MRSTFVFLFALALGCRTPPLEVQAEFGIVRAHVSGGLSTYARALDDLAPQIKSLLESSRNESVEVWVLESKRTHVDSIGVYVGRRIELGRDAWEHPETHLAHELVHWYGIQSSPYQNVPWYMHEGLADWIACDLTGKTYLRDAEHREIGELSVGVQAFTADRAIWNELSEKEEEAANRIGYEVVKFLGLARVKSMAASGADPLDYAKAAELISEDWIGEGLITVSIGSELEPGDVFLDRPLQ